MLQHHRFWIRIRVSAGNRLLLLYKLAELKFRTSIVVELRDLAVHYRESVFARSLALLGGILLGFE